MGVQFHPEKSQIGGIVNSSEIFAGGMNSKKKNEIDSYNIIQKR